VKKHLVFGYDVTGVVVDLDGNPTIQEGPVDLSLYWAYEDPDPRSNQARAFEGAWRFLGRNKTTPTELRAHPSMLTGVTANFAWSADDNEPSLIIVADDRCEPGKLYYKGE
jgi:hypothetical protein